MEMNNKSHSNPERKRLRLNGFDYADPSHVYFITICARKETYPFLESELARDVVNSILFIREQEGFRLYCYCLMPDHLHLAISPSNSSGDISDIVRGFKSFTTKIAWEKGTHGKLWQKSFYDHVIRSGESLLSICEYILANPIRKGLASKPEEWKFSGMVDPLPL